MSNNDISSLRALILKRLPSKAAEGQALKIFKRIADDKKSQGTVGKQLMSIVIPSDLNSGIEANYISEKVKREIYFPYLVYLLPDQHLNVENISIEPRDKDAPPLSVPKVGRNNPCPCGSKIKYKYCHGRKNKAPIIIGPNKAK